MREESPAAESETTPTERAAAVLEKLFAAADVSRAFGPPMTHGDATILPAAEVIAVAGFGLGSGGGIGLDRQGQRRRGGGGGGGGGGYAFSRRVAVVVASSDGVGARPVIDVTRIALAALTAAGFVLASWRRGSKAGRLFDRRE